MQEFSTLEYGSGSIITVVENDIKHILMNYIIFLLSVHNVKSMEHSI